MYTKSILRIRNGIKHRLSLHVKDFDIINNQIVVKQIFLVYTKEDHIQCYQYQYRNKVTGEFYPEYSIAFRSVFDSSNITYEENPELGYILKRMRHQWGDTFKEDRLQVGFDLFALFKSGDVDYFRMENEL